MMAATPENNTVQDPLGLQTFALSESAYDLVCTLRGAYGRMIYAERQKPAPDQQQIDTWRLESQLVLDQYQHLDGNDLNVVEQFIKTCADQWRNLKTEENPRPHPVPHV